MKEYIKRNSGLITAISIMLFLAALVMGSYIFKENRAKNAIGCYEKGVIFMISKKGRDQTTETLGNADYIIRNGYVIEVTDMCK